MLLFSGETFHSVLMLLSFHLHMTAKKGRKCQQEPWGISLVFKTFYSCCQVKVNHSRQMSVTNTSIKNWSLAKCE